MATAINIRPALNASETDLSRISEKIGDAKSPTAIKRDIKVNIGRVGLSRLSSFES